MNEEKKEENIDQKDESENEIIKCQKERDEYLDGWKRAKAELINYKKTKQKSLKKSLNFPAKD